MVGAACTAARSHPGFAGNSLIATLIKNARLADHSAALDVRIEHGLVSRIGVDADAQPCTYSIDARGGMLLPGLHDHHMHLMAYAAARESLHCGPPGVTTAEELAAILASHNDKCKDSWLRCIGYHPCVAGDIDRHWLDRHIPDRPVRLQHRGGRLWVLNSRALQLLAPDQASPPPGLETAQGDYSGRLYEGDTWLRSRMARQQPDIASASRQLGSYGITGLTDTTPGNGPQEWQLFQRQQAEGALLQRVRMMGSEALAECRDTALLTRGELKVHLLESQLPDLDELTAQMRSTHAQGRGVAIHCVTVTELVFALHCLEAAGVISGDRIEHASVCPPEQLRAIRDLGLRVVTQPHFIHERGEQYLADVEADEQPWLYRARSFISAGIPLAGGSDAPFGGADPWMIMHAAVARSTRAGTCMGAEERLSPEQALDLFLSPPAAPGTRRLSVEVGATADLCLLHQSWEHARDHLSADLVRCTWRDGQLIHASGDDGAVA